MYQASIGETEDVRPLARAALALDARLQSSAVSSFRDVFIRIAVERA
jgi:hypothetical protein